MEVLGIAHDNAHILPDSHTSLITVASADTHVSQPNNLCVMTLIYLIPSEGDDGVL